MEVINARGQEYTIQLQTPKVGVVETRYLRAATGAWTLRWQVGADKETRRVNMISPTVRVENFVPERMNVAFSFDKAQDLPSDTVGETSRQDIYSVHRRRMLYLKSRAALSLLFYTQKNGITNLVLEALEP